MFIYEKAIYLGRKNIMKQLLCTLGPSSFNPKIISRIEGLGATMFRLNLSHTKIEDLEGLITHVQGITSVPLCLDTEGAQIRTGDFGKGSFQIEESSLVRAHLRRVPGSAQNFNFYPIEVVKDLEIGDFISIDFNSVLVQVVGFEGDGNDYCAVMRTLNGGSVGQNKAVTVARDIALPSLTEKDRAAIEIGKKMGIKHFALSFASSGEDVSEFRRLTGMDAFIISKIESDRGLKNFDQIADGSDAILIDRGDLSRQVPIEQIPAVQKRIIRRGKERGTQVFVATNLLESMVTSSTPTRAEVNDIFNTLTDGADGLVLAAETAIGQFPTRCASMIVKVMREHSKGERPLAGKFYDDPVSLLPDPHGGELVRQVLDDAEKQHLSDLLSIQVARKQLQDCEQVAFGVFSPIRAMMSKDELYSVLQENKLLDGTIWTMPIILQVPSDDAGKIKIGMTVGLCDDHGDICATVDVSEVYQIDLDHVSKLWFGTAADDHPGVQAFKAMGDKVIAGKVNLVQRQQSAYRPYELTPAQSRFVFSHKGWAQVVGFHTRNVVHRAHHALQLRALEETGCDGLFVSPVLGDKKKGDFLPSPIIKSYQTLIDFGYYPDGKIVLGSFSTHSRYCGPREAVFTAICRKNMGCSHFIIGRDHTGVGDFYAADANRKLFDQLGDLGIKPVFVEALGYCDVAKSYVNLADVQNAVHISGTGARQALLRKETLPNWYMHAEVQEMLAGELAAGRPIFQE